MAIRVVIAPDKFKGSLTSQAAAEAMARGFKRVFLDAEMELIPVADGGDGTAATIVGSLGGRLETAEVSGPNGTPVQAHYGIVANTKIAIIELAQASGLALVAPGQNNPLTATTFGTGQLIAAAIDAGMQRIVLAIGGSATNDAGTGALSALGARFLDAQGQPLPPGGAALAKLDRIETDALEKRLAGVTIEIASDVRNPLCGPVGASAVYGPQKGASPADVRTLDSALERFAAVATATTGANIQDVPGSGAAGGTGAGFLALAHATIRPGAELVLEILNFDQRIAGASLVVTGEGRIDRQTLSGKAPHAVAQAARKRGVKTVAIAGSVECQPQELDQVGIFVALSILPGPMRVEEAMQRAAELVERAAETLGRALNLKITY